MEVQLIVQWFTSGLDYAWQDMANVAPGRGDGNLDDISDFGHLLLLHKVAAQRHPYGLNATEASVWSKKKAGKMPCRVPNDCPEELEDLMRQCCAVRPGARPTMAEVADCLERISSSLDGQ